MPLNIVVAELLPKVTSYSVHFDVPKGLKFPERVLYIPLARRMSPYHLDSLVTEIQSSLRRSIDVIIIRAHGDEANQILKSNLLGNRLHHRFEQRPVWLLFWKKDGFE